MTPDRRGPVGVGVIGAGVISAEYLTNLTTFRDITVRMIADIDMDRAAARAAEFGVAHSGSVAELLADDDIEIVVNLTIPQAHVAVATAALDAGKHVWSEKPFALDRASGAALLAVATARGLRVATAPDTFLGAGLQTARRLLDAGEIGRPLTVLTLMQSPGPESWHPNPDFLFQDGAGPLFDIGPYYLTAMTQLLGPIRRVTATAATARAVRTIGSGPRAGQQFDVTVPTHVTALYEFADGRSAQSIFSFDSAIARTLFEVTGTDGAMAVPDPNRFDGATTVHRRGTEPRIVPADGVTDATRGIGVVELARAIRAGVPERAAGANAFHVVDVMTATIESAASGAPVTITSAPRLAAPLPEGWDPRAKTLTP